MTLIALYHILKYYKNSDSVTTCFSRYNVECIKKSEDTHSFSAVSLYVFIFEFEREINNVNMAKWYVCNEVEEIF